jgi:hypothetical protein
VSSACGTNVFTDVDDPDRVIAALQRDAHDHCLARDRCSSPPARGDWGFQVQPFEPVPWAAQAFDCMQNPALILCGQLVQEGLCSEVPIEVYYGECRRCGASMPCISRPQAMYSRPSSWAAALSGGLLRCGWLVRPLPQSPISLFRWPPARRGFCFLRQRRARLPALPAPRDFSRNDADRPHVDLQSMGIGRRADASYARRHPRGPSAFGRTHP